jgi:hypothetical protein
MPPFIFFCLPTVDSEHASAILRFLAYFVLPSRAAIAFAQFLCVLFTSFRLCFLAKGTHTMGEGINSLHRFLIDGVS